jgi:dinuclear metal center YbgI/SA1388 family protein
MIETRALTEYLDELLGTSRIPDYPGAVNGLQLSNDGPIKKIAAAVDFSSRSVKAALAGSANLLLVHHGMFWSGLKPITGASFGRIKSLIQNDVAVYSSHLPLDCHPTFGNNVLLSRTLNLEPDGEFAHFKETAIGVRGRANTPTTELVERARTFARSHGGELVVSGLKPEAMTKSWAICTGAGASAETLEEAVKLGVDTLIVGEGPHWTAVEADEIGITIIYAGHYATETLGVRALAQHLAERFSIEWIPVDAPTGL